VLEAIFVLQFLWIPFVSNSTFWVAGNNDDYQIGCTEAHNQLQIPSWITQFTLLGGELWFAILSIDLYLGLTNPFSTWGDLSNYNSLAFKCTFIVYSIAFTGATLVVTEKFNHAYIYGLSNEPLVWIKENESGFYLWYKFAFFYVWLILIYVHGLMVFIWAKYYKKIDSGLEDTIATREDSIRRQTKCK